MWIEGEVQRSSMLDEGGEEVEQRTAPGERERKTGQKIPGDTDGLLAESQKLEGNRKRWEQVGHVENKALPKKPHLLVDLNATTRDFGKCACGSVHRGPSIL